MHGVRFLRSSDNGMAQRYEVTARNERAPKKESEKHADESLRHASVEAPAPSNVFFLASNSNSFIKNEVKERQWGCDDTPVLRTVLF